MSWERVLFCWLKYSLKLYVWELWSCASVFRQWRGVTVYSDWMCVSLQLWRQEQEHRSPRRSETLQNLSWPSDPHQELKRYKHTHISESFLNHTLVTLLWVTSKISPSQINCNVMKLCESVPLNDSFQRISYKMIQWFLDFITDINFTLRFNWVSLTMMFIVISCVLG